MINKKNKITQAPMTFKEYRPITFDKAINTEKEINDFGACKQTYNFDYDTGALIDSFGIEDLKTKATFVDAPRGCLFPNVHYRHVYHKFVLKEGPTEYWSILFMIDNNLELYYYPLNRQDATVKKIEGVTIPYAFTFLDTVPINNDNYLMWHGWEHRDFYLWKPMATTTATVHDLEFSYASICVYNNRTFAATAIPSTNNIIYSEEYGSLNYMNNNKKVGSIKLDDQLGMPLKLMVFQDKLYVIRERGINRITQSRDKVAFEHEIVETLNTKIFHTTIQDCGDRILFWTIAGLYEFDGNKCKRIRLEVEDQVDFTYHLNLRSGYVNNTYYLSVYIPYADEDVVFRPQITEKPNSIIIYNIVTGKTTVVRGLTVTDFVPIVDSCNSLMAILYWGKNGPNGFGMVNTSGIIKDQTIRKKWISKMYDFGDSNNYKFIKEMEFVCKSNITLMLYFDDEVKKIQITGKNTMQTIKINRKAKSFGYGFESMSGGNYISKIKFLVGKYGN